MTDPRGELICAATFMAAVGDIRPVSTTHGSWSPISVWTLGSTSQAARRRRAGHISKHGSASSAVGDGRVGLGSSFASPARCTRSISACVHAAGTGSRSSPAARKLARLFWFLLTREEDYAHQQPSLTAKKLRLLEIRAGAPTKKGTPTGVWATRQAMREGRAKARRQAETPTSRWSATGKQQHRRRRRARA